VTRFDPKGTLGRFSSSIPTMLSRMTDRIHKRAFLARVAVRLGYKRHTTMMYIETFVTENPRPVFRLSHFASRNSPQSHFARGIGATCFLTRNQFERNTGCGVSVVLLDHRLHSCTPAAAGAEIYPALRGGYGLLEPPRLGQPLYLACSGRVCQFNQPVFPPCASTALSL
jgi:hypothetical protein